MKGTPLTPHDWAAKIEVTVKDKITLARETGRCKICSRTLTNSKSIVFGIGPICRMEYPGLENCTDEDYADEFIRKVMRERGIKLSGNFTFTDVIYPGAEDYEQFQPVHYYGTDYSIPTAPPRPPEPTLDQYDIAKSHLSQYRDRKFRVNQKEATDFICSSPKKYVFLEAPTGSGKSLIAMTAGEAMQGVTYAVHTKILQNQITQDFPEAASLFGRANYSCISDSNLTCEDCTHSKDTPCRNRDLCPYQRAKQKCLHSRLRILNYDYLLTATNYANEFQDERFNIIDEADNLESTLLGFTSLMFTEYDLNRLGVLDYANSLHKTGKDQDALLVSWQLFAQSTRSSCANKVSMLKSRASKYRKPFSPEMIKVLKELKHWVRLLEKIDLFIANVDKTWLLETSNNRFIFRPLWMNEGMAQEFLWKYAKKWVMMSASFLPIRLECKRLGIPYDQSDYLCLPSTFPIDRRPIHIENTVTLSKATTDIEMPKLAKRINEILNCNQNVKGLIHGVSYTLCDKIVKAVNSPRLITHNSSNRQETVDKFKDSSNPLVLVSPSMERGVSFEQDFCRFVIIAKAPFLNLGDKIINARVYSGPIGQAWYQATMLSTVLQMTGRGMRSEDDYCISYILDANFNKTFQKNPGYLPMWWRDGICW